MQTYVNGVYIDAHLVYDMGKFASLFDQYYADEFHSQIKDRGARTAAAMSAACQTVVGVCTTFMAYELIALVGRNAMIAKGCDARCLQEYDQIVGLGISGEGPLRADWEAAGSTSRSRASSGACTASGPTRRC
jgi:hypothetical protein